MLSLGLFDKIKSKTLHFINLMKHKMIDTICLLIPKDKMVFLSGVSSWELYSKTSEYEKFVRNPSRTEKETGKYFPRLTGYKRRFSQDANVRLEFSAPKLVYLNNLEELEDADFSKVVDVLQERLRIMGVVVSKQVLENASVSSVHFSKNIKLTDGYTVNHIISELGKIDLRKSFDFAKTRFLNDGQSLYAHTTSHEFVIYDKIADLNKGKKRAIDKDQTLYQMNLFTELKRRELQEVIRFEVRLNRKPKMNQVLKSLGYSKNPCFKGVFGAEVSKKVVNSYWKMLVTERNSSLFSMTTSAKDTLRKLFTENNKLRPAKAVYLLGLSVLSKDEGGMRQLRSILSGKSHDRTWYRIAKDTQLANDIIGKYRTRDWVIQLNKELEDYKPYKLNPNGNKN